MQKKKKPTTHKGLQKMCVAYLEKIPQCKVTSIIPGPYGSKGISDLLVCLKGWFIAIELKIGDDDPTKLQEWYLGEVAEAGGVAFICRSLEEVKEILDGCEK
ncbi:MAG TPA: VRR-NUC domain-containing protein [Candidatus Aminicenantes bacterium]|nr:VRR-NUC domain-containing protein [Candidatus Aminicenantes bacterium]